MSIAEKLKKFAAIASAGSRKKILLEIDHQLLVRAEDNRP